MRIYVMVVFSQLRKRYPIHTAVPSAWPGRCFWMSISVLVLYLIDGRVTAVMRAVRI